MTTFSKFTFLALAAMLCFQSNGYAQWNSNGTSIWPTDLNDRVGLGTSSPLSNYRMTVRGTTNIGGISVTTTNRSAIYGYSTGSYSIYGVSNPNRSGIFGLAPGSGKGVEGYAWGSGYSAYFRGKSYFDGGVRIGTFNMPSGFKLAVKGGIMSDRIKVELCSTSGWCDYVFEEDYDRNPIEKVAAFVKENKHLPNVPSAKEVEENGIDVAEMDAILLRQVEELWLNMIDMKNEIDALKEENMALKNAASTNK